MTSIKHFLLVFDHKLGKLVQKVDFGKDASGAIRMYEQLERENRDNPYMDIVLLGSDSIETVQVTHKNYFNSSSTLQDIEAFLAAEGVHRVASSSSM